MEETTRRMYKTKTIGPKQNQNPAILYLECDDRVGKFQKQLKDYLSTKRDKQLQVILPPIENLAEQIKALKQNIGRQATQSQQMKERYTLATEKESLLNRIKGHSKEIQALKKQIQLLAIDHDELVRQYQENNVAIKDHLKNEQMSFSTLKSKASPKQKLSFQLQLSKKMSLPSLFANCSHNHSVLIQSHTEKESKWQRIDRLLSKMASLKSDSLAEKLALSARHDKDLFKSIVREQRVNEKMGQWLRSKDIRPQWSNLTLIYRQ